MATLNDIIEEVLLHLEGFTGDQDLYGTVGTNITDTDSVIGVNGAIFPDGSGFTAGIIEVNDELIYAQSFDRSTAEFSGCLRGWRGTTAQSHVAGTLVRNNPKFPRIAIKRAINDTIKNLHPRIPVIKSYEFKFQAATHRYELPAGANGVIAVYYDEPGPSLTWVPVRRWSFDTAASFDNAGTPSVYETKPAVNVYDAFPGRQVQVLYTTTASPLESLSDDFTATTGLPDWIRDIIIYGACYRLTPFIDAGKVVSTSVDQAAVINNASYGSASLSSGQDLSKYYYALYNTRLVEAEERIRKQYPAAVHYIR